MQCTQSLTETQSKWNGNATGIQIQMEWEFSMTFIKAWTKDLDPRGALFSKNVLTVIGLWIAFHAHSLVLYASHS